MTTASGNLFNTFKILLVKKYFCFIKSYFVLCVSNLYTYLLVSVDKLRAYLGRLISVESACFERSSSTVQLQTNTVHLVGFSATYWYLMKFGPKNLRKFSNTCRSQSDIQYLEWRIMAQ